MPTYKSVDIRVHGGDGQPLPEWGAQQCRGLTSCYIQSKNDMQFSVSLTPTEAFANESRPFQLLATLRLNGRERPEKSCIVYLDKSHKYYKSSVHGRVVMNGRMLTDRNGKVRHCRWFFKGAGIESMLDDLDLNPTSDAAPEEDALISAFKGFSSNLAEKVETSKTGTIDIELQRVYVADTANWREAKPEEYIDDTDHTNKLGKDISHSAARTAGELVKSETAHILHWPFDQGEAPYAKFKFYYRSEDVLRKFGFDGFMPKELEPVDRVNQSLARSKQLSPLTKRSLDESTMQVGKKFRTSPRKSAVSSGSDSDSDGEEEVRFASAAFNKERDMLQRSESMTTHAGAPTGFSQEAIEKLQQKPTLQWNPQEGASSTMQMIGQQTGRRGSDKENEEAVQVGADADEIL